jgi:hypothetical protein
MTTIKKTLAQFDCTQALQELDRTYPASYELFKCEALED